MAVDVFRLNFLKFSIFKFSGYAARKITNFHPLNDFSQKPPNNLPHNPAKSTNYL
jgi:hypothetical protein